MKRKRRKWKYTAKRNRKKKETLNKNVTIESGRRVEEAERKRREKQKRKDQEYEKRTKRDEEERIKRQKEEERQRKENKIKSFRNSQDIGFFLDLLIDFTYESSYL